MKRALFFLIFPAVMLFISVRPSVAEKAVRGSSDVLGRIITEVLEDNPEISSARARWMSKKHKIVSAYSPPQPQGEVMFFGEPVETRVGPQERKYGLIQKVPFPTKLIQRGNAAAKEAMIAYNRYLLARLDVVRQTKKTFYDLYFAQRSLQYVQEEKTILENMSSMVKTRYQAAEVPQQDLVKADLEISKLDDMIISLEKQKNLLSARLNKLMARSQNEKMEIPGGLMLRPDKLTMEKQALLKTALLNGPYAIVDELDMEKKKIELSLAKQEYLPDLGFMGTYIETGTRSDMDVADNGKDAWAMGVKFSMPVWFWKINSDIKSARSGLEAAEKDYADKTDRISFHIEDLVFKIRSDHQLIDLYSNVLVPQAQQNFTTARTAYESGRTDFLNWLDAERNVIRLRIGAVQQMVSYKKKVADLEYIVGEEL